MTQNQKEFWIGFVIAGAFALVLIVILTICLLF